MAEWTPERRRAAGQHTEHPSDYGPTRQRVGGGYERRGSALDDLTEPRAQARVETLIDEGVVEVQGAAQALVHTPTGQRFEAPLQLVNFHRGWMAGQSD